MKKYLFSFLLLLGIIVGANAQNDMTSTPLTFEAVEAGTITVMYDCFGDAPSGNINPIQYKLNDGSWTDVTWNTDIELAANDVISFHGNNVSCYDSENWEHFYFVCSNDCNLYGNVMSLLSSSGFATMTTLTEEYCFSELFCNQWTENTTIKNHTTYDIVLPATILTDYCYNSMFNGCAGLTRAPELPATTMAKYCYNDMFNGCTNLVNASALPATTLAEGCYTFMFWGCTSLTTAPELPAMALDTMCYDGVFMGCTSLVNAPELPATTLVSGCYSEMFMGCTSLETAPVLPADSLADHCYHMMFNGCTSLNSVTCLATDISAEGCTSGWLTDVAATGTFVKAAAADWSEKVPTVDYWGDTQINGIPEGWTVQDYTPYDSYTTPLTLEAVQAGTITIENPNALTIEYNKNGTGWTSANTDPISITVAAGDVVQFRGDNASYWASGDSGETVTRFTASNPVYVYGNIMSLIDKDDFATNTTLTEEFALAYLFAAPSSDFYQFYALNSTIMNHPDKDLVLPATTLTGTCYGYMFAGCEGLTRAPELPATTLAMGCYHQMFADCSGLTVAPSLPAATLAEMCYSSMFYNCTSLTTAPDLPATTLSNGCYMAMFSGCTGLTRAPELPATILSEDCYHRMFEYSGLTQAPVLPAATLIGQCYGGMFDHCTNLNYVRCMATDLGENNGEMACGDWLKDVAATGTFVKAPGMDSWTVGPQEPGGLIYGIPEGWTTCDKVFQTSGNWNVAANWNTGAVPAAGSDVVIAANVMVPNEYVADAGSVFIEEGNTLTIADGGQLKHSNEVQGTIQKFIAGYGDVTNPGGYYLLGAPINMDSTVAVRSGMVDLVNGHADFETHGIDLYEFSQSPKHGLEWLNMRFGHNFHTFGLLFNEACLYARADDAMLNISTTEDKKFVPTSVDNSIMVMRTISTPEPEFIGWNLIRNPYTCNAYLATGRDFYRMNAAGDAIVLATNENGGSAIKPCEGFFVVVGEHDPEQVTTSPNTGNTTYANIQMTTTEPQPNESKGILDITVKQEGQLADVARVRFDEGEHTGKLMLRNDATHLSITRDNKNYSVVHNEAQGELPLSFKAKKNGNYTLSVNPENVEVNYLHLIDNMTGTDVDLLALRQAQGPASYNFTAKTTDYESRFKLVFSANTEDSAADGSETFAFYSNGNWIINSNGEATLQVTDVTGRILSSHNINGSTEINLNQVPGVYMLRLINGADVKVQKVVVQ